MHNFDPSKVERAIARFQYSISSHDREEGNNIDPDDGNSWLCSACNLPIFSTPFIKSYRRSNTDDDDNVNDDGIGSSSSRVFFLHDQCANLPGELEGSDSHPGHPLILHNNLQPPEQQSSSTSSCVNCKLPICETMFYYCPDHQCRTTFDVLCALTIRILHRSHHHRLMVVRTSAAGSASFSFFCCACGTQHDHAPPPPLFYMCTACRFWIHPHCASLPNVIVLHDDHHNHPLLLNYGSSDSSKPGQDPSCRCAICGDIVKSSGVYSCTKCNYYVHIMCAVSNLHSTFKPVLIREARLPDVVGLPIPDERTSVIRYIMDNTTITTSGGHTSSNSSSSSDHTHDELVLPLDQLHEHPLIFQNDHDDDDDDDNPRLCNCCIQFISPPFYQCSECPDFFLHDCCALLPRALTQHPAHEQHPLYLVPKPASDSLTSTFYTSCCLRDCNGFAYSCRTCDFRMDVLCALIPASIMHDAHTKTHILYSLFVRDYLSKVYRIIYQRKRCDCCGIIQKALCYECRTCRIYYRLHSRCALLPNTVRHKFDQHPLTLFTSKHKVDQRPLTLFNIKRQSESGIGDQGRVHSSQQLLLLCEICEQVINNRYCWYYSCQECEQSFHTDCIPYLDSLSKIKFGVTSIHVQCHHHPLTLIRGRSVCGHRCEYCRETFTKDDGLAFECSKCYIWIHSYCARKCGIVSLQGDS